MQSHFPPHGPGVPPGLPGGSYPPGLHPPGMPATSAAAALLGMHLPPGLHPSLQTLKDDKGNSIHIFA